jgi:hypothetical protein
MAAYAWFAAARDRPMLWLALAQFEEEHGEAKPKVTSEIPIASVADHNQERSFERTYERIFSCSCINRSHFGTKWQQLTLGAVGNALAR